MKTFEMETDFLGNDFDGFDMENEDTGTCMKECANNPACKAWTF